MSPGKGLAPVWPIFLEGQKKRNQVREEFLTVHPNLLKLADPDFEPVPTLWIIPGTSVVRLRPNGEGA